MSHAYQDHAEDIATSYRRIHGNGEETHVHILSCGEDRYCVVAYDIDPVEYIPVASELIAYSPTLDSAHERATVFMEQNPKGLASDNGASNSGIMAKLKGLIERLNNYGNDLANQNNE